MPTGRPAFVFPAGTERDGIRARFTKVVKRSERYMAIGSSTFSLSLKAGAGAVGQIIKSYFCKTSFTP